VRKGDLRSQAGDDRMASAFYKAALRAAGAAGALPASLRPALTRAQAGVERATRLFQQHLEASLALDGFGPGSRPPRFQESLEILTGARHVDLQLQRPVSYYYPGLPQRRYYERSEFSWVSELEAVAGAIRDELLSLLEHGEERFSPYLVTDPLRQRQDLHGLIDNLNWSTLYLWEKGGPAEDQASLCPRTLAAMHKLDLARITTRAPSILFSRLRAGARIPPHTGMLNGRLICHLPLIVPPACGFRVGGETRQWREGELIIFDDTVEHEAWNDGESDRIILIFDIWRPELGQDERAAIMALFKAIDGYQTGPG
jgi:aspartyl/asparaginyl beta-hydroxylase (cupin superfamily)